MVSSCCARRKSFSFLFRSAPLALSLPPLPCRNSFLFITSASLLTACTNNNSVQSLVCHKQPPCSVTGLPQTTSVQSLICHQHSHHTKAQTTTVYSDWSTTNNNSMQSLVCHQQSHHTMRSLVCHQHSHHTMQSLVYHPHSHHTKAQTTTVFAGFSTRRFSTTSTVWKLRNVPQISIYMHCDPTHTVSASLGFTGIRN